MSLASDWPTIDPGQFRTQITLLEPVSADDASGESVTYASANNATKAWAKIEYVRGTDVIRGGQDTTQVYVKVVMWFNSAFDARKRIQLNSGKQFIIQSAENVREQSIFLVLNCIGIDQPT